MYIPEGGTLAVQGDMVRNHAHTFSGSTGDMSGDNFVRHPGHTISGSNSSRSWYDGDDGEMYNFSDTGRHKPRAVQINLSHTHGFSGTTDGNDGNATETRPANYTVRVWQRTA